mgnify:CR=1 FL=1
MGNHAVAAAAVAAAAAAAAGSATFRAAEAVVFARVIARLAE